jgi:hypothetical protein
MRGTILDLIGHGYPDKLLILIPQVRQEAPRSSASLHLRLERLIVRSVNEFVSCPAAVN